MSKLVLLKTGSIDSSYDELIKYFVDTIFIKDLTVFVSEPEKRAVDLIRKRRSVLIEKSPLGLFRVIHVNKKEDGIDTLIVSPIPNNERIDTLSIYSSEVIFL